jgi:hypothetical protein
MQILLNIFSIIIIIFFIIILIFGNQLINLALYNNNQKFYNSSSLNPTLSSNTSTIITSTQINQLLKEIKNKPPYSADLDSHSNKKPPNNNNFEGPKQPPRIKGPNILPPKSL